MAKVGRPKGPTCSECRAMARVRCMVSTEQEGGKAYPVYKCFEHYVDLENASRLGRSVRVISAEIIRHRR